MDCRSYKAMDSEDNDRFDVVVFSIVVRCTIRYRVDWLVLAFMNAFGLFLALYFGLHETWTCYI